MLVLSVLGAISQSLEMPSRQSLVPELVEKKHIVNAIGLGATAFNAAACDWPAIAAIIIESIDIGAAFTVSALSNAGVALTLLTMRPIKAQQRGVGFLETIVEGLSYVWRTPHIFGLMGLMVVFAVLGRPYVSSSRSLPAMSWAWAPPGWNAQRGRGHSEA